MKEKVTVTAKVQVLVSEEQRNALLRTGEAYRVSPCENGLIQLSLF